MTEDLEKLASVASTYNEAVPDLLSALESLTVTSKTMVAERTKLADVYASVIGAADTTTGWVSDNQDTIEILSDESRAALEATAPYASQFPCLLKAARQFIPEMDKTLGKGTTEPGIHVRLNVVEGRGKYLPGKDAVKYTSGGKARCPYVTGRTGTKPASDKIVASKSDSSDEPETIAPPPTDKLRNLAATGLGDANSPAENQLIAELLAPTQAMAPAEYPDWGSLLVGPTLRNTKVTLS
ncbi:MCE family protein [Aeromicrobium sp. UC242_57]|uniref:MCE family protein n=1 Tax=Aeromicrobium sp. UC242_57 TaxID=3374624 RepID=UPI00378D0883